MPAAAPTTSFMAAAILLPASRLISCAFAAISATVSFTSAPRWPGLRRGGIVGAPGVTGARGVPGAPLGAGMPGVPTAGADAVGVATANVLSLSGIYGLRSAQGVVLTGYEKSQKWGFDPHWRELR